MLDFRKNGFGEQGIKTYMLEVVVKEFRIIVK